MTLEEKIKYCNNYGAYEPWQSREISIGTLKLGGNNPLRLQSMSSCAPMDTKANVAQSIRIIEAGGELVRFTAPTTKEAANLESISKELRALGYTTPLVADIHFNPLAALTAAKYVEKVRVNPGNFAEGNKRKINYTEEEYQQALEEIEVKFVELINECKSYHRAIRVGSNHGSLSQRIMDRYGDTPKGMVEAAMEFLSIAQKNDFNDIVLSMKSSNIRIMVQAYRLLAYRMREEGMNFPLHLGVTEAGEGEDGRIKSAAGIGSLLEDGLGDTLRVSLTEEPEFEIPIAKIIAERYNNRAAEEGFSIPELPYNPFEFKKRISKSVLGIGGNNEAPVIGLDWKYNARYQANEGKQIIPFNQWKETYKEAVPYLTLNEYMVHKSILKHAFVELSNDDFTSGNYLQLQGDENIILVFKSDKAHCVHAYRYQFIQLINHSMDYPVILHRKYASQNEEYLQIYAAIDFASLFVDGLGDGIWIESSPLISQERLNEIALGILQASRVRISKTDFISCPSCGRTLYNIQEATALIRAKTSHLKGLKIAIMGCIVNGPGEMADADYGYVGAGIGKINLYKGKEVIAKRINEEDALERLIELIKANGDWQNPTDIN